MTAVDTRREVISKIVDDIRADDGLVYADDIATIMDEFDISPAVYSRVMHTLEEVVRNRTIAQALRDDPRHAAHTYIDGYVDFNMLDSVIESYEIEAERGIQLIIGLAVFSRG